MKIMEPKHYLSPWAAEILRLLSQAEQPVSAVVLARQLQVHRRTILRALPQIDHYAIQHGMELIRKPGVGLQLKAGCKEREQLRHMFAVSQSPSHFCRTSRQTRLLGILLFADAPIPYSQLKKQLAVCEGTLRTDLQHAAQWMADCSLRLERLKDGIWVSGSTQSRENAIAKALYESMNIEEQRTRLCEYKHNLQK